jgi:hypothetical protein
MIALAKSQSSLVKDFAYKRFPLMVAFRCQLDGDIPARSSGLSKSAVMQYSAPITGDGKKMQNENPETPNYKFYVITINRKHLPIGAITLQAR